MSSSRRGKPTRFNSRQAESDDEEMQPVRMPQRNDISLQNVVSDVPASPKRTTMTGMRIPSVGPESITSELSSGKRISGPEYDTEGTNFSSGKRVVSGPEYDMEETAPTRPVAAAPARQQQRPTSDAELKRQARSSAGGRPGAVSVPASASSMPSGKTGASSGLSLAPGVADEVRPGATPVSATSAFASAVSQKSAVSSGGLSLAPGVEREGSQPSSTVPGAQNVRDSGAAARLLTAEEKTAAAIATYRAQRDPNNFKDKDDNEIKARAGQPVPNRQPGATMAATGLADKIPSENQEMPTTTTTPISNHHSSSNMPPSVVLPGAIAAQGISGVTEPGSAHFDDSKSFVADEKLAGESRELGDSQSVIEATLVTQNDLNPDELVDQIAERLRKQMEDEYSQRRKEEEDSRQAAVMAVKIDERIEDEEDDVECCFGFSRRVILLAIGAFVLVAVIAGVVVAFVVGPSEPDPTNAPTAAPTTLAPTDQPSIGPSGAPTEERICPPFTSEGTIPIVFNPADEMMSVTGTTTGASSSLLPAASCGNEVSSPTVLYRFQVEAAATVLIHTCSPGTELDTVLILFRDFGGGQDCNIACNDFNDDSPLGNTELCSGNGDDSIFHSSIEVESRGASDIFYVAVAGFSADESGPYELSFVTITPDWDPGTLEPTDIGSGTIPPTDFGEGCPFATATPVFEENDFFTNSVRASTSGSPFNTPFPIPGACGNNINEFDSSTVWYRFQPGVIGSFLVDTCSEDTLFDTVVAVYLHDDADGFGDCTATCVGFNDDHELEDTPFCGFGSDLSSAVQFESTSNDDIFYIAVAGFDTEQSGFFELFLAPLPAVPNPGGTAATCPLATAIPIEYDPSANAISTITGTTVGAAPTLPTAQACESFNKGSPTVWYKFQTDVSTSILITTCSPDTTFDTFITVFQGSDLSDGNNCNVICLDANDDFNEVGLPESFFCDGVQSAVDITSQFPSDTFYIAVSGFDQFSSGSFELRLINDWTDQLLTTEPTFEPTIVEVNGNCPFATATSVFNNELFTTVFGSTVGSLFNTPFIFPSACGQASFNSPTTWFKYQPGYAGVFLVHTCSPRSEFDTVIAVYLENTGAPDACSATCIGYNDDHVLDGSAICGGQNALKSAVEFVSTSPLDTFYFAVSGLGPESGDFELLLEMPSPPVDPDGATSTCPLSTAIPIDLVPNVNVETTISGTTAGAVSNLPTDYCDGYVNNGSSTVWYRFRTDFPATVLITTCSPDTTFDTILSVFLGSEVGGCNVICVHTNDDYDALLEGLGDACGSSELHSALVFSTSSQLDTYYIAVSGFDAQQFGPFALRLITVAA